MIQLQSFRYEFKQEYKYMFKSNVFYFLQCQKKYIHIGFKDTGTFVKMTSK